MKVHFGVALNSLAKYFIWCIRQPQAYPGCWLGWLQAFYYCQYLIT